MGHAPVENGTPYAFDAFFLMDESGRALCVPILKATYALARRRGSVRVALAEPQVLIDASGKRFGDADDASYVNEPECASFVKVASDVALVGHAVAPRAGATESAVTVRVGAMEKRIAVRGDRRWVSSSDGVRASEPEPFERIPLVYERAMGGWDRTDPDPTRHAFEPRNPVGVGFRAPGARFEEGPLPNLEDPDEPLTAYAQSPSPPPACPGFVSPGWEPRARLAGTLDATWERTRMPLLPEDFDRRFFNAASPGLVADGYLRGGEEVYVEGVSTDGPLHFALPVQRPPRCRLGLRRRPDVDVALHLDTLVIDADVMRVSLIWRGHCPLPDSAHDVRWVSVR